MISIAVAQYPVTGDVSRNRAVIQETMHLAKQAGVRLLHLTEGALSGYTKHHTQGWSTVDWSLLDEELALICELAKDLKLWVVLGSISAPVEGEFPRNSLFVISDSGLVQGRYDKRYCSHTETGNWFTAGEVPYFFEAVSYTHLTLPTIYSV